MNVFYSDSKTDLKLRWDFSIKFHLFQVAQDVVTRLTAVCCMLLSYRFPQHYKRHVCGAYCSCKHRFLWISPIFEHWFCLNYMGTVRHWQPFWSSTRVRFIGQCWYFNPQGTPGQAIIKAGHVRTILVSWEKCTATKCLRICRCLWRGLGGRGVSFSLPNESLTFIGPAA